MSIRERIRNLIRGKEERTMEKYPYKVRAIEWNNGTVYIWTSGAIEREHFADGIEEIIIRQPLEISTSRPDLKTNANRGKLIFKEDVVLDKRENKIYIWSA